MICQKGALQNSARKLNKKDEQVSPKKRGCLLVFLLYD